MYRIIVNNVDIIKDSNNITWNNDSDSLGTQLSFDSIKEIPTGTVVQLFNDSLEIFRGIALKPIQKRWTWSYTCQDYSFYLKNKIPIAQFNGLAASEAIKSLLDEAYLTYNIVYIPTVIKQFYTNRTRSEIIDDILDQATKDQGINYIKEIQGNVLYIYNSSELKIVPKIILPKEINIEFSMENMKNRIYVISGNDDKAAIQATAEDQSQQGFYGTLTDVLTVDGKNLAQAQNIANNALSTSNKIEHQSTFEVIAIEGGDTIKANRMIYLNAGSRLGGYYKIKNAQHTLTKGLHKVSITITW